MKFTETGFTDLYVIEYSQFSDNRGDFVKTIHAESFEKQGLEHSFTESYYSISKKDVIRGMHFQNPPHDHVKLVYVIVGSILDVVLDIRKESKTYGQYFTIDLTAENRKGLYIGKGFAHGFLSRENDSIVEYHTSTSQDRDAEAGILYNSFGFDWGIVNPNLSDRDSKLITFKDLSTLFK